jgi:tetratricopeptide (TPR) repeat protein
MPGKNPEDTASLFQAGLAAQQQGRAKEAARCYARVLERNPNHVDALHFCGLLIASGESLAPGIAMISRAIALKPDYMAAHFNLANVYRQARRPDLALGHYERALTLAPDDLDVLVNLGDTLRTLGRGDDSLATLQRAVRVAPTAVMAWQHLGQSLLGLMRCDEARAAFEKVIGLEPASSAGWTALGLVAQAQQFHQDAIAHFTTALGCNPRDAQAFCGRASSCLKVAPAGQVSEDVLTDLFKAIQADPDYLESYFVMASALRTLSRLGEAESCLHAALSRPSADVTAMNRGAIAWFELRRFARALEQLDRALALDPLSEQTLTNRAAVLRSMGRLDEAVLSAEQALRACPQSPNHLTHLGALRCARGETREALDCFDQALALDADHPGARFNRAQARLASGHLVEGWPDYELRTHFGVHRDLLPPRGEPQWSGAFDVAGKTVLLRGEQGYGDTLQFVRYARNVESLGASVVIEVQAALTGLIGRMGFSVIAYGEALPLFDCYSPIPSLPGAFKTTLETIPGAAGYLDADPAHLARWSERLGRSGRRPLIAVSWSGQRNAANNRAIPLSEFARLFKILPNARFVGVQPEVYAEDKVALEQTESLEWLGAELASFEDTAAILCLADLVITIDSALAHLSGALARPTWVLLPHVADWRWFRSREDSPWYRSMRLFRQSRLADWSTPLESVATELARRFRD